MEKKNSKGLIILVVVLSILVVGLGGYIIYDKFLSNSTVEQEKTEDETLVNLENYASIYNMINRVIIGNHFMPSKDYFYKNDNLYVTDMSYDDLVAIALNNGNFETGDAIEVEVEEKDGVRNVTKSFISNARLQELFTNTFGDNVKYYTKDFTYLSMNFKYDKEKDMYVAPGGDIGSDIYAVTIKNNFLKTIKTKESIEVYDAVAFLVGGTEVCKDFECKERIATLSSEEEFNIENYVSNLNQYKYIFKLNADGNYYFYGVELVK